MFNKKKRKPNLFLFTASLIGTGAVSYYLTKDRLQGEDRDKSSYSSDFNTVHDL
ncbi:hypothetical protein [Metabacillus malikii]|uniref:Uncharacterized protein n=1 Tax=Metabacillus malikii TaxID=1504265 RepID=A0ABT9ZFF3_9BACI|nr:hypothetical protein [Metabacillus malikii]MDQ0230614.1 hypothetical protein [Metabacillus malikii]